ncbi:hypothetical protein B6U96_07605 [Archaeoglobales archaeon ex4484_92]|nr:MAG: hypothetical protein B6U96_07605 [Archaeoglobales archaeon ex4484_92]
MNREEVIVHKQRKLLTGNRAEQGISVNKRVLAVERNCAELNGRNEPSVEIIPVFEHPSAQSGKFCDSRKPDNVPPAAPESREFLVEI